MKVADRILGACNWPTPLLRAAIRAQLAARLRAEARRSRCGQANLDWVEELRRSEVAPRPADANAQHYEVPTAFFEQVLGSHWKYSCGWWDEGVRDLSGAEEAMLALTVERAAIRDGDRILDLGCGWGSFALYAAARFPRCTVTAVSNSATQRARIEAAAAARNLSNLHVLTRDVNDLAFAAASFDRVVSVEMFEHARNYAELMRRIAGWLRPGGTLFVHVFGHRQYAYPFVDSATEPSWMTRHFFANGQMPSADLLLHFQEHVALEARWIVPGNQYRDTCEAWLRQHEARRPAIERIFAEAYGASEARRRWVFWKLFFLACSELFGYDHGRQWMVYHYRFARRDT